MPSTKTVHLCPVCQKGNNMSFDAAKKQHRADAFAAAADEVWTVKTLILWMAIYFRQQLRPLQRGLIHSTDRGDNRWLDPGQILLRGHRRSRSGEMAVAVAACADEVQAPGLRRPSIISIKLKLACLPPDNELGPPV
ncbi:unnamed protein product [Pleuronectes platessa]|uniref:Uncharacterized protein n=1 Tax=Pleuronectes platessa TaxID=8262 RepID=A0A9N7V3R1_PLEPL|nr:unnamed protein product [Pleuronectes platessa]